MQYCLFHSLILNKIISSILYSIRFFYYNEIIDMIAALRSYSRLHQIIVYQKLNRCFKILNYILVAILNYIYMTYFWNCYQSII